MTHFLERETPGKVFSLLGVAMFSMALMLGVSVTDASFSGTAVAVSDPFGPEKVMAVVDHAANSYSNFLAVNLINPLSQDYAMMADDAGWVLQNSGEELAKIMNIDLSGSQSQVAMSSQGRVAGASTVAAPQGGFSIDTVYSFLVQ